LDDDREEMINDDFCSRVRAELPDKQKNCVDVRAKRLRATPEADAAQSVGVGAILNGYLLVKILQ
jgi:hypothetical protein